MNTYLRKTVGKGLALSLGSTGTLLQMFRAHIPDILVQMADVEISTPQHLHRPRARTSLTRPSPCSPQPHTPPCALLSPGSSRISIALSELVSSHRAGKIRKKVQQGATGLLLGHVRVRGEAHAGSPSRGSWEARASYWRLGVGGGGGGGRRWRRGEEEEEKGRTHGFPGGLEGLEILLQSLVPDLRAKVKALQLVAAVGHVGGHNPKLRVLERDGAPFLIYLQVAGKALGCQSCNDL